MNVTCLLRFGGIRSFSRQVLSLRKSRGSVHRFTLVGMAMDGASCDLKVYAGNYSISLSLRCPR